MTKSVVSLIEGSSFTLRGCESGGGQLKNDLPFHAMRMDTTINRPQTMRKEAEAISISFMTFIRGRRGHRMDQWRARSRWLLASPIDSHWFFGDAPGSTIVLPNSLSVNLEVD